MHYLRTIPTGAALWRVTICCYMACALCCHLQSSTLTLAVWLKPFWLQLPPATLEDYGYQIFSSHDRHYVHTQPLVPARLIIFYAIAAPRHAQNSSLFYLLTFWTSCSTFHEARPYYPRYLDSWSMEYLCSLLSRISETYWITNNTAHSIYHVARRSSVTVWKS
jgi:hypothetical protein